MTASGWPPIGFAVIRYDRGRIRRRGGAVADGDQCLKRYQFGQFLHLVERCRCRNGRVRLTGGIIASIGAVIGAVTLAFIGALPGALGVNSDFNAATQGAVLIMLLAMRYLARSEAE
jgi:ribose transport system ATP-binding protein